MQTIILEEQATNILLRKPWRTLSKGKWAVVSAPGRADFLNTHQDYKGLPVVPIAVNLRTYLFAKPSNSRLLKVTSLDLKEQEEQCVDAFEIEEDVKIRKGKWFGNYFRGVVRALNEHGFLKNLKGLEIIVKSQVPIGAGLASSATLEVAFLKLLDHIYNLSLTSEKIAELAFQAENMQIGIPCGRLDQYGSTFGGIIKLECRPPYKVERLAFQDLVLTILDSGIRHSTADIHPYRQEDIDRGLRSLMASSKVKNELKTKLGLRYDKPRWETIDEEEIKPYLDILDEKSRKRIVCTLKMQRSTEVALKILMEKKVDPLSLGFLTEDKLKKIINVRGLERVLFSIGEIMNYQHELLRDLYDVSLPQLEKIRDAALRRGALGVKISGAGLGGSLIGLAKDYETAKAVLKAGVEVGATRGWISNVDEGVRIDVPYN